METRSQVVKRWVVVAAIGAAFMASLDLFVVNVAFDDIGSAFGVGRPGGPTAADLSWVLNAYAVTYAALLVPFGRLADRYGRKPLFLAGLAGFVAASAACALSEGVWALVIFRVLQAAAAAAMTPTSLSILIAALPAERRLGGVRLWAATGAIAAAIGPTVGGLLTQLSWHWVFLINVPVGLGLLWIAATQVRDVPADEEATTPDLLGAVLFAVSVGLLALALVKSPGWGWTSTSTLASLAGSVVAAGLFVQRSRHHPAPVIHPELLRIRTFRWANVSMIAFSLAFAANLLVGILWLQQVWGWSAMTTGYAIAAGPVMVPITAALTHRLLPGVSPAYLVAAGSVICAAGVAILALRMGPSADYAADYLPGWLVGGVGVGLALPNLVAGGTRELPPHQSATGSGVVTMARQIGFVIGVSVLFAIVGDRRGPAAVDAFVRTWWVAAAMLLVAAVTALGMRPRAAVRSGAGDVVGEVVAVVT